MKVFMKESLRMEDGSDFREHHGLMKTVAVL